MLGGYEVMVFDANQQRRRLLQAAEGYLILDMTEQALESLRRIVDPGPDRFSYYMLQGEVWRARREHHRALEWLQQAHELAPQDLDVLMAMAWCFKRTDRLDLSIDTMRQAYQFHATTPVVLYNLACYYSLAGNKEQALSWLGRALRLNRSMGKLIPDETDFDPLRGDPDFQHLLELVAEE